MKIAASTNDVFEKVYACKRICIFARDCRRVEPCEAIRKDVATFRTLVLYQNDQH